MRSCYPSLLSPGLMLLNWAFRNWCSKHQPGHCHCKAQTELDHLLPRVCLRKLTCEGNIAGKTAFALFKHVLRALITTLFQAIWHTDKRPLLTIFGGQNLINHQVTCNCLTLILSRCHTKNNSNFPF